MEEGEGKKNAFVRRSFRFRSLFPFNDSVWVVKSCSTFLTADLCHKRDSLAGRKDGLGTLQGLGEMKNRTTKTECIATRFLKDGKMKLPSSSDLSASLQPGGNEEMRSLYLLEMAVASDEGGERRRDVPFEVKHGNSLFLSTGKGHRLFGLLLVICPSFLWIYGEVLLTSDRVKELGSRERTRRRRVSSRRDKVRSRFRSQRG